MYKLLVITVLLLSIVQVFAQEAILKFNKDFKPTLDDPEVFDKLDDDYLNMFNNLNHPLAITGGALTVGGAVVYLVGSGRESTGSFQKTTAQYVGVSVFAVGAVLFTIFSTDRDKSPKRKKVKQQYKSSEWEAPE